MKISIKEFVETGEFGPVKIGMPNQEIREILGEPDSDNDMGENGHILLYAWYEFFINHEDKLQSIQNDNYDPTNRNSYFYKNEKIEIDSWILNNSKNQTLISISKLLDESNIDYAVENYYGREVLKVESGVIIDFSEDENDSGVRDLQGIRLWP